MIHISEKLIQFCLLQFIVLCLVGCISTQESSYEEETKLAEEIIKQSNELGDFDKICKELLTPKDFRYIGKTVGNNKKFVQYNYKTLLNYEQVKQFYTNLLNQNGWELFDERDNWGNNFKHRKESYIISVTRNRNSNDMCSIVCKKVEKLMIGEDY